MDEQSVEKWAEFADKLRDLTHRFLQSSKLTISEYGPNDQKFVACLLLMRTFSHCDGIFLLVQRPLIVEMRILLRCAYENLFYIAALSTQGQSFVEKMKEAYAAGNKSLGEFVFETLGGFKNPDQEGDVRVALKDISKRYPKARTINPKSISKLGPLNDMYVWYGQLSVDAAHPTLKALRRHFFTSTENGQGTAGFDLQPIPESSEVLQTLNLTCNALIASLVGVKDILGGSPLEQEIADRFREYETLILQHE